MDKIQHSVAEDKFRNLIELAADGILIGSHDGIVMDANSTFCKMIEMSKEELVGSFIGDLPFTKESLQKNPLRFDLLKKGEVVISERELVRSDSAVLTIEMRTKMMPDGTYQSIYRDISDRKRNEIQLINYANELSKLNADKDHFISILAHDLVSPFNTILGFLNYLSDNFYEHDVTFIEKQIHTIRNSAEKTFELLQDILTWIRSNSGAMPFDPEELNLHVICEKVVDILNPSAKEKKISLEIQFDRNTSAFTDVNMLRTVLRNLITNAIKFTDIGGRISLTASQNDNFVKLFVSDTGNGISPEKQKQLFSNLQNRPTEGTLKEKGSGLGLVISKLLVEKQGGSIGVESEPGNGSTFYFTIPVRAIKEHS